MKKEARIDDMYSRQADLVPQAIQDIRVLIVGCGSIGSNAAHVLGSMGVRHFTLVDFDSVGMENIGPSWFSIADVDKPKAQALADRLRSHFDIDDIEVHVRQQVEEQGAYDIVLSCTDNIKVRETLWQDNGLRWNMWLDGRMGGWNAEFYAIRSNDQEGKTMYNSSFGPVTSPLPCGMKATAGITKGFFTLALSSAIMTYLEDKPIPHLTLYNGAMPYTDRNIYAD